jgi:hypothetical protein
MAISILGSLFSSLSSPIPHLSMGESVIAAACRSRLPKYRKSCSPPFAEPGQKSCVTSFRRRTKQRLSFGSARSFSVQPTTMRASSATMRASSGRRQIAGRKHKHSLQSPVTASPVHAYLCRKRARHRSTRPQSPNIRTYGRSQKSGRDNIVQEVIRRNFLALPAPGVGGLLSSRSGHYRPSPNPRTVLSTVGLRCCLQRSSIYSWQIRFTFTSHMRRLTLHAAPKVVAKLLSHNSASASRNSTLGPTPRNEAESTWALVPHSTRCQKEPEI